MLFASTSITVGTDGHKPAVKLGGKAPVVTRKCQLFVMDIDSVVDESKPWGQYRVHRISPPPHTHHFKLSISACQSVVCPIWIGKSKSGTLVRCS